MNTRPFTELYGLVEALCGCTFATQEQTRVNHFINRRARKAYAESEFWPRFYVVGEERVVSEAGLLSDEQSELSEIGTVLRIHATAPFLTRGSVEYADFHKTSSGTQITGYDPNSNDAMIVSGVIAQDATDTYLLLPDQIGGRDAYAIFTDSTSFPNGSLTYDESSAGWTLAYVDDSTPPGVSIWEAPGDVATPDMATTWAPSFNATGTPVVTAGSVYVAFITYKAALTTTYGTADGEESDFPEEWFDYAAHGAYSDWLRSEAQQDRAALAEAEANEILMQELEKIGRQGGSAAYTRVVNHGNTQWR